MHRLIYLVVFFTYLNVNASGIDTIPFSKIDSLTYSLYLKGDWTNLKSVGDKLLDNKIDWYYLRLRLAEANIQLNNPALALKHILKAEKFSGGDAICDELTIRSNLQYGRYNQALFVVMRDKSSDSAKSLKKRRVLNNTEIEGVIKTASNPDLGVFSGLRFGTSSYFGKRFSLYLSGQFYSQKNSHRDSLRNSISMKVEQQQYYAKLNFMFSKDVNLFLGGQFSSTLVTSFNQKNYLAFGGLEIIKPYMKYKISAASTDFNNSNKIISSAAISAFPLGNNDFYSWMTYTNIYDADSSTDNSIVDVGVGGRLAKNLWTDIFVTPMHYDFHTLNDYEVTFNLQDRVNFKIGGGLSYYGFKNLAVKVNYIIEYMQITGIPQVKNYTQNTITLCLSWYR
ncbi:MAG TPA: hypothetical protein PLG57_09265 [Bacteroidia bacterium]|jgi:hypothetical protein|nr:hypothetical protein [Bacteroidia bacterium]HQF27296.1 hypothetical protein [Bacteroidia bacterium]HQK97213.1 hypothetical protein [Bacteroidia bacterium]